MKNIKWPTKMINDDDQPGAEPDAAQQPFEQPQPDAAPAPSSPAPSEPDTPVPPADPVEDAADAPQLDDQAEAGATTADEGEGQESEPYRLRIPSEAERHRMAREQQLDAADKVWRLIGSEVRDQPTDPDLTEFVVEDALAALGHDWEWLSGWVDRIRAAKSKLHPVDLDKLRAEVTKATTKLHRDAEKAAKLRQQADELEQAANGRLASAREQLDVAQRSEAEAALLAQEAAIAWCPGTVDLGLRDRPRIVRCIQPTVEGDRQLSPGDLLHYRGPDRPWFEDYTGDVQLDEHGRGHGPIDTPDINQRNEQIAEDAEAAAQQFEAEGLPGVRLHHEGEQRTLVTQQIQVTQRPTREADIVDQLPTQVEVTVQPSDGQAGQAQSDEPEQSDPWGFNE